MSKSTLTARYLDAASAQGCIEANGRREREIAFRGLQMRQWKGWQLNRKSRAPAADGI